MDAHGSGSVLDTSKGFLYGRAIEQMKHTVSSLGMLMGLAVLVCSCNEQVEKASEPRQDPKPKQSEQVGDVEIRTGRVLKDYEKQLLGLIYPTELLEAVRIHMGPPEKLPSNPAWGLIVQVALQNGYGITVGEDVYFPEGVDTAQVWGIQWLVHELRHVEQYRQAGGVDQFGRAYVWYLTAGLISLDPRMTYVKNPFENDARVYDGCMEELLRQRPELVEGLSLAEKERGEWIGKQIDKYEEQYKQIIWGCLGQARKRRTRFEINGGKSFTIDFQLKGEFTGPVGRTVSLGTSEDNSTGQGR